MISWPLSANSFARGTAELHAEPSHESIWTPTADSLNRDGVPIAQGGAQWYAATVRHVLLRTA